jgi:hypothetical protein
MKRTKRARPELQISLATWRDGSVVVRIADAGVAASMAEAARHSLEGEPWTPETLQPQVMEIVGRALRRTQGAS